MQTKSLNGPTALTDENQSLTVRSKTWGLTLIARDLKLAGVIEVRGNAQMVAGGPTGVIIFIPGGSVGDNDLIHFPELPTLAKTPEPKIANAKPGREVVE